MHAGKAYKAKGQTCRNMKMRKWRQEYVGLEYKGGES